MIVAVRSTLQCITVPHVLYPPASVLPEKPNSMQTFLPAIVLLLLHRSTFQLRHMTSRITLRLQ